MWMEERSFLLSFHNCTTTFSRSDGGSVSTQCRHCGPEETHPETESMLTQLSQHRKVCYSWDSNPRPSVHSSVINQASPNCLKDEFQQEEGAAVGREEHRQQCHCLLMETFKQDCKTTL